MKNTILCDENLRLLFKEMADHLEYCGYGDSYERSFAKDSKLPQRVIDMLEKLGFLTEGR